MFYVSRHSDCLSIIVSMSLTSVLNVCNYSIILQLISSRSHCFTTSIIYLCINLTCQVDYFPHTVSKCCVWSNFWLRSKMTSQIFFFFREVSHSAAGQGWHETLPASFINGTGCFHNEETVWKCFRWEPMMAMNSDFYISVVQLRCWVFVLFCLALVFVLLVRKVNE